MYVLTDGDGHFIGLFTSPQKAALRIYHDLLYRHYRGYIQNPDMPKLEWHSNGNSWDARENGMWDPPEKMGECYFNIAKIRIDPMTIELDLDLEDMKAKAKRNSFGEYEDIISELPHAD